MFSTGRRAVLQLPCCLSKQGELSENISQNLSYELPPQTVHKRERTQSQRAAAYVDEAPFVTTTTSVGSANGYAAVASTAIVVDGRVRA